MTLWEDIVAHPERAFSCDLERLPTMALVTLTIHLSDLILARMEAHEAEVAEEMRRSMDREA